jgi:hypothetical protein
MGDILIAGTLLLGGYLLSNETNKKNKSNKKISKKDVTKNAIESFNNLPPSSKEKGIKSENAPFNIASSLTSPPPKYDTVENNLPEGFIQSPLTNIIMPQSEFNHNNMKPHYRGRLKQNLNPHANTALLDSYSGSGSLQFKKKEIEPLFRNDRKDIGLPFGSPNQTDVMKQYIQGNMNQVIKKNGERPFEQIQTGPGLNKGYTNTSSGGFNQVDYDVMKRYMNVDNLRTANNPKLSYKGTFLGGKSINVERGVLGEVRKKKPDRFYSNLNGERNFVTTGAYRKRGARSKVIDKKTNRQETSAEYYGNAGHRDNNGTYIHDKKQYDHTMYNIKQLESFQIGPAHNKDNWNISTQNNSVDDYGRKGFENKPNQRTVTGVRSHGLNVKSLINAVISPLLDIARRTRKENMIGAPRIFGNFGNTAASGHHYYDENDKAKTTTRETIGRTDYIGAPTNVDQRQIYYVDPRQIAKYTHRGTTTKTDHFTAPNMGNNTGGGTGAYVSEKHSVPTTNRQTTSQEYVGIARNVDTNAPQSYTASYNARLNPNKQILAQGRTPVGQGPKNALGKNAFNIQHKKHEADYMQTRIAGPSTISSSIPNREFMGSITGFKNAPNINISNERNQDFVVSQFNSNPYTQSLQSAASR